MTKEDYMKLSKERLAELLVEKDREIDIVEKLKYTPLAPYQIPCYAPNGICMNPYRDCINCPKLSYTGGTWTTDTNIK